MKKIYTIAAAAMALICTGCSLDREPLNGPSTGSFPASEEEALAGVLVSYKNIANSVIQYCPFPFGFMDEMTDIGATRIGTRYELFTNSTVTADHSIVEQHYKRVYKTLGRLHLVLDNLDNLAAEVDPVTLNQFKAECLCLRAYCYDLLCQVYGDVPFIDHCLTLNDYAYARTAKEDVIERILKDMDDELIDCLPVSWPYASWGTARIGRATAYALKARICLNWGRFEEAAVYSRKAMELSAGVYSLTDLDTRYYATADAGEPDCSPLFGREGETSSKEWMWAAQFNKLVSGNVHQMIYTLSSRNSNGAAYCGPTQALMDTFQCKDGLSISESPLYDYTNPWKNRDPRLDLYCVRSDTRLRCIGYDLDATKTTVTDYVTGAEINNSDVAGNKSEYGPNGTKGPGGYLWRKYQDPAYYGESLSTSYEDDIDVIIMRYAELLLIDAEANIEWEGGDLARARADINEIRARVDMPEVTASSREELRSALRYERKVELCNEGFRWFDIRRWGIAGSVISGNKYAPGFSSKDSPKNHISNAKPVIDENWTVTYDGETFDGKPMNLRVLCEMKFESGKDELWPFPYTEMITNPLIGLENNNPGY